MSIKVEYLLIDKNADAFCKASSAFHQMLDLDERLQIVGNKICYLNGPEFDYSALGSLNRNGTLFTNEEGESGLLAGLSDDDLNELRLEKELEEERIMNEGESVDGESMY